MNLRATDLNHGRDRPSGGRVDGMAGVVDQNEVQLAELR